MAETIKPTKKVTISFDVDLYKFTHQGDGASDSDTEILEFEKDLGFLREQIGLFFAGKLSNFKVEVNDKEREVMHYEPLGKDRRGTFETYY